MPFETEAVEWLVTLFNDPPLLLIAGLTILGFLLMKKKSVFLLALVLSLLVTPMLKDFYAEGRPCTGVNSCPSDYGFPSQHSATAFVFAASSWGEWSNLFFLPLALFTAWSRLHLGVHTFEQVAGGMALGVLFVHISEVLLRVVERRLARAAGARTKGREPVQRISHELEFGRKAIHVLFGLFFVAVGALLERHILLIFLGSLLSAGLFISTLKSLGLRLPILDQYLLRFERPGSLPGRGVVLYAGGVLFLFSFSPTLNFALAVAGILALGDGLATLIGKAGWTKLPWNPSKTARGTMAFFAGGFLASVWFLGVPSALFYSVLLALVESLPLELDDNLLIPVAGVVLQALTGV